MRFAAVLLAVIALLVPSARAELAGPLVTPQALRAAGPAPLILDIRPAEGPGSHTQGHIPGAVSAPYDSWRGPTENPGLPLTLAALTERLRSLGVRFERPVVIVHQGVDHNEFGAAARVYWTLKSAGHDRLAILNGGHAAWVATGLPVTTGSVPVTRSAVAPLARGDWTATRADVAAAQRGDGRALLVDARPEDFFRGLKKHGAAAEAGTLSGALNLAHSTWFDGAKPVLTPSEGALARARALVARADGAPVISFCNTGHWAATNWFVLSELLGAPGVKLYPESVVGWSRAGLPLSPGG